jgi:hypothetical protein
MIRLPNVLRARGTPEFSDTLRREIEKLDPRHLPLQQALSSSSRVTDRPFQARIISIREEEGILRVKAGIFYTGIIAGCSCADDPTPIDELNEYCVVRLDIDTSTAEAAVTLLDE